jgi:hypothetical protein
MMSVHLRESRRKRLIRLASANGTVGQRTAPVLRPSAPSRHGWWLQRGEGLLRKAIASLHLLEVRP